MNDITEHDTKEEGECHNGKDSRVDFFVIWDSIGINDLLESPCHFIGLKVSGFK